MTFLAPAQLAWLGLLVPLIALYVLKRRRQRREVGSTLLWEAALRDLRAERPWKKLVPNVSLLLQVLAILLGAIALARPAGAGRVPSGARLAVVVDTSVSMAATDGERTRIERARDVARSLARGLPPGGDMMLIEASGAPTVLAPPSRDATALERAIDALEPAGTSTDLEGAVSLAAERLRGAPSGSRIVLLTDAAVDGEIPLDGRSVPVEVQRVGEELPNTAIVAADARARPTAEAPDRADVFVRLVRFAEEGDDEEVFVTAAVEGRGVVASRRVLAPAGETTSVVMPADLPPDATGRAPVVRVELAREGGPGDAMPLDDVAVVPSPGARRLPVFLVGNAPRPVEKVLVSDEEVELFATSLERLASRGSDQPALDGLFVFAGETPEQAPPGDSVVVAPPGDSVFEVDLGEAVASPRIVTWEEDDPRLRFVTLSDVHLRSVRPIEGPAARPLVTTDAGPAIATITRPDGETTLVSFDPAQTDWPRHPSFVVFFRNLLERARTRRAEGGVAPGTLGEPLRVPAPDGTEVEVTTPGGATLSALSRGGVAVVPVPPEPGVFRVRSGERQLFALRDLTDAEESDLAPRARFTRAGEETGEGTAEAAEHREAWPWLALALLLIIAGEALWATRRRAPA